MKQYDNFDIMHMIEHYITRTIFEYKLSLEDGVKSIIRARVTGYVEGMCKILDIIDTPYIAFAIQILKRKDIIE